MNKLLSVIGWILTTIGILFFVISGLVLIDMATGDDPKTKSAFLGMLVLTGLFAIPGGILLWRVRLARAREQFESQFNGFVASLDSFTPRELAQKIGKTEMETEALLAALIAQRKADLAFHRQTGRYLHRNRLQRAHQVIDRCPSCGASVGQELVFAGEAAECRYCGNRLATM
ncbi:MAG: hypothetical protein KC486_06775 [Myxococcales bacterium]|nr:hypothetical protein [Myxococcales bacterium]